MDFVILGPPQSLPSDSKRPFKRGEKNKGMGKLLCGSTERLTPAPLASSETRFKCTWEFRAGPVDMSRTSEASPFSG